jgi:hypothetical protein
VLIGGESRLGSIEDEDGDSVVDDGTVQPHTPINLFIRRHILNPCHNLHSATLLRRLCLAQAW